MRQQLDIYASVSLCKTVPGFPTRHRDVDFVIIRENTEGEYSGLEHQVRSAAPPYARYADADSGPREDCSPSPVSSRV